MVIQGLGAHFAPSLTSAASFIDAAKQTVTSWMLAPSIPSLDSFHSHGLYARFGGSNSFINRTHDSFAVFGQQIVENQQLAIGICILVLLLSGAMLVKPKK